MVALLFEWTGWSGVATGSVILSSVEWDRTGGTFQVPWSKSYSVNGATVIDVTASAGRPMQITWAPAGGAVRDDYVLIPTGPNPDREDGAWLAHRLAPLDPRTLRPATESQRVTVAELLRQIRDEAARVSGMNSDFSESIQVAQEMAQATVSEAQASAELVATSKEEAASSATSAAQSANDAATHAEVASRAALESTTAASQANSSSSQAVGAASSASTSAATATTQANEASASASAASQSAQAASGAALEASTAATRAVDSATSAADSASSALTSSSNASGSATSASASAERAEAGAVRADESAGRAQVSAESAGVAAQRAEDVLAGLDAEVESVVLSHPDLRGPAGVSVESVTDTDGDGTATVAFSDGSTSTLPLPPGKDGHTPVPTWQGTALSWDGGQAVDLRGVAGQAPSIKIGAVTSGATPSATITGTSPDLTLDLVLKQGEQGIQGPPGVVSSASSYVLVGPGRPDVPATTGGVITGAEPVGAEYRSTDGASVGAWVWRKRPNGWTVTDGDTGWRDIADFFPTLSGLLLRVRRITSDLQWHISAPQTPFVASDTAGKALPAGFRSPSTPRVNHPAGGTGWVWLNHPSGVVVLSLSAKFETFISNPALPTWPTAPLPGTPA